MSDASTVTGVTLVMLVLETFMNTRVYGRLSRNGITSITCVTDAPNENSMQPVASRFGQVVPGCPLRDHLFSFFVTPRAALGRTAGGCLPYLRSAADAKEVAKPTRRATADQEHATIRQGATKSDLLPRRSLLHQVHPDDSCDLHRQTTGPAFSATPGALLDGRTVLREGGPNQRESRRGCIERIGGNVQ